MTHVEQTSIMSEYTHFRGVVSIEHNEHFLLQTDNNVKSSVKELLKYPSHNYWGWFGIFSDYFFNKFPEIKIRAWQRYSIQTFLSDFNF